MKSQTFDADHGALFFALVVDLDFGQILQAVGSAALPLACKFFQLAITGNRAMLVG